MLAIVTGAAGALGTAVSQTLVRDGYRVIGLGIEGAEAAPDGLTHYVPSVDLRREDMAADVFASLKDQYGPISALVNVAGSFVWEMIADSPAATWQRMFEVNLLTALNAIKAATPCFAKPASIVTIGAGAAARATSGMAAYTASKSGVARLTEALSEELKPSGVRANLVSPSIIDTAANRADMPDADFSAWVTPTEVAEVIAFLVSDRASGVTGAEVRVNGRV